MRIDWNRRKWKDVRDGYSNVSERGVLRKVATTCFHGDRYTSFRTTSYRIERSRSNRTVRRAYRRDLSIEGNRFLPRRKHAWNFVEETRCLWLRFTVSHSFALALHDDFHCRSPFHRCFPIRYTDLNRRN